MVVGVGQGFHTNGLHKMLVSELVSRTSRLIGQCAFSRPEGCLLSMRSSGSIDVDISPRQMASLSILLALEISNGKRKTGQHSEAATPNEHIADCFGVVGPAPRRTETADKTGWHFSPAQYSRLCCEAIGWTSDYCRTFTKTENPTKSSTPAQIIGITSGTSTVRTVTPALILM